MLKLEHINKSYTVGGSKQIALKNISLSFRKNEFVAILGPSGSGKTTFIILFRNSGNVSTHC